MLLSLVKPEEPVARPFFLPFVDYEDKGREGKDRLELELALAFSTALYTY